MTAGCPELLRTGPAGAAHTIVLAHGAGAGMRSPFMTSFAEGLGSRNIAVCRFDFPYMQEMSASGHRLPPNREPVLRQYWQEVIAQFEGKRLLIGGKSLGGRIASLIADDCSVAGLICLGYPFHPPGRPERTRTAHLADLRTPTLICQGTRDPLGNPAEVGAYHLSPKIALHWLGDGDHSFVPRRASGRTAQQNWTEAMDRIAEFAQSV